MGRIIVLKFDDNANAVEFLKRYDPLDSVQGELFGEYYLPAENVYCRCDNRVHVKTWVRHKKFWLFVCKYCGKPSRYHRRGLAARLREAIGRNLLDEPKPKVR